MVDMNPEWKEVVVPPLDVEGRVRLDAWLARELITVSRSKVQEMILNGLVKVNRVKVTTGKDSLKEGDVVSYALMAREKSPLEPIPMVLEILYEDEHLLVVNKPAGISVHPGAGETGPTLVNGLLAHAKKLGSSQYSEHEEDEKVADRPGIVHRLDKDTTGLLVVAKTDHAHAHLSKQFHDKVNFRQYVALLNGVMPEGEWVRESWLHRDPRERTRFTSLDMHEYVKRRDKEGHDLAGFRYARTLFKREAIYGPLTLASIRLYTGRTHQIRIHAKDMGAPIIGDQTYGRTFNPLSTSNLGIELIDVIKATNRQLLHAWILGFEHPETGKWLQFEGKLPEDFSNILDRLKKC